MPQAPHLGAAASIEQPPPPREVAERFVPAGVEPVRRPWPLRVIEAIVLLGMAGMVLTVALQVISRQLGSSIAWTEELTRYLFIYTTFMGMAAGFFTAEHARIGFVVARLWAPLRRVTVHLYAVAGVAFFGVVGVKGWELTLQQYRSHETSPVLGIGMWIVTLPIVLSAALAAWAHIHAVYRAPELRDRLERGAMTAT
jgi:TRAP-type C4-dicarboxylate transport system permease small subunit